MNTLLGILLIADGLYGALWVSRILGVLAAYDGLTLFFVALRGLVSALLCTTGWMLVRVLPPARVFAIWTMAISAGLVTLEIGFRLSPSSVFPTYRWPLVALYLAYAVAVIIVVSLKGPKGQGLEV